VRALVVVTVALALAPAATADPGISVVPSVFSPAVSRYTTIVAQLPAPADVAVRLASAGGTPLAVIDPPSLRSDIYTTWNGRIHGRLARDGFYSLQLVAGGAVLGSTQVRLDTTPPTLEDLRVTTGPVSFEGDTPLLATVSPNGDGYRDVAHVQFTLAEPARLTLVVQRANNALETLSTHAYRLRAGPQDLAWDPGTLAPRTYILRLEVRDRAGNTLTYGPSSAFVSRGLRAPVVRVQGVDAAFTHASYAPGQRAVLHVATDATALTFQVFQAGPETVPTYADNVMNGVAVGDPFTVDWSTHRDHPADVEIPVGAWPSGVYFVRATAADGRIGFAPFVVRPARLGATSRIAVIVPTNTWQAYNFYDANGDGWGDTWYTGRPIPVVLDRPFLRRGVPPFFRRYDLGFLHWLAARKEQVDFLAESDLSFVSDGAALASAYDLVVYPGHTEYVTDHEYDLITQYRDAGGNLIFLSANDFFWRVEQTANVLRRTAEWRTLGRPESALIGVQYLANDRGTHQGVYHVVKASDTPWLWAGTGLGDGSTIDNGLGGYGIEIDHTTALSPPGTIVLAEIPDVFGPGLTAQMSYYETPAGARVFAAGALDFGGSADTPVVSVLLANLWARLSKP
jgi:hypothetical protein